MAKDHFVAQTYLRQWASPSSAMLRGYGKRTGKEFPCAPKDVCHEWDWDVNPYFKEHPRLLGDYRKIFEPQWRPTIAAVRTNKLSAEDKFVLSGYWALLTTCTPSWHRSAVILAERQLADFIPLLARNFAKEKPEYQDFVEEAIMKGWIKPNPDGQQIKAMLTQQLTRTMLLLYQLDWVVLRNSTDAPFITSDNPSSVFPRRPFFGGLARFLPLAPDLALFTAIDPGRKLTTELPDLERAAPGKVRRGNVTRKQAARLNRVTVMNADELVFSTRANGPVGRLVRNHRDFSVFVDHARFPTPDGGFLNASTMMVRRERAAVR
ncbi:Protein of unknown function [Bradyrhizobium shewense]|uniref:DUF4238 domain-containing protein n=1 Tax=Bradyrhizobium shewense TaxID=1761772 RepID=A0A1C3WNC0_9BRAD|nr:DUF4238 domain-containing protein [Bradyrhizobium shewense]SCB41418.1 Protein of unknown function [Bradyrhizobium shewense]